MVHRGEMKCLKIPGSNPGVSLFNRIDGSFHFYKIFTKF